MKYRAYLREIEKKTGRKIQRKQIRELKNAIKNGDYSKPLDKKAYEDHTTDYYKQRDKMRDEWSQKTGQEWPKYKEDVYSKNGKPYLYEGDNYDLHHIIERKYGGPNTWWNSHPASNPIEHQAGIHGSGSIAKELFP